MATRTVDTVTLEIVENTLRMVRHEMDAVMFRASISPMIRETHDTYPLVADRNGRMLVGQFGSYLTAFFEHFDEELAPGDVIVQNDPYLCGGSISHTPDVLVLRPVFHEGVLVGFTSQWSVFDAAELEAKVENKRPLFEAQQIKRGRITTADGEVIANSRREGDDESFQYVRQYPLGSLFGHDEGPWAAAMRTAVLLGETPRERSQLVTAFRALLDGDGPGARAEDAVRRALVETLLHGNRGELVATLDEALLGLRPRPQVTTTARVVATG